MKLVFRFLLFFVIAHTQLVKASKVHIYFTEKQNNHAKIIRDIFLEKYKIPLSLIKLRKTKICNIRDQRFLELCLNSEGELIQFPNSNIKNIKKSLNTFSSEAKND
jgi:hypothetical protein